MLYGGLRFFGFYGLLVPIHTLVSRIPVFGLMPDNIVTTLIVGAITVVIILFLVELAIAFAKGIVEFFERRG